MSSSSSAAMQTPPFLTKLLQLVNDPSTNELVSWSDNSGRSFTVHKPSEFGRDVLPKYFKHNNFSSFVRQLNQYGFHKQNPDKWMFGHDSFRRDDPEMLRNITRRRPKQQTQTTSPVPSTQAIVTPGQALGSKAVVELGNYGIEGEVKALKRDKDLLIKELVVTRQAEKSLKNKCDELESRMEALETSSKRMQAFIMHYFSQVLQPYSQAMASKKRKRITASSDADMLDVIGDTAGPSRASSQPVSHPPANGASMDALRVMMQQMQMNMARAPASPRMGGGQGLAQPALVEGPVAHTSPDIGFEPATVQELPQEDQPSRSPPATPHVELPAVAISGIGESVIPNGTVSVQDLGEDGEGGTEDDVLDFLQDMPSTPNSSMTMEAIETALKEPSHRANGKTHLDTPEIAESNLNENSTNQNGKGTDGCCDAERDKKTIEEFLELDSEETPLPPPLTHLPEGTDIHALAMRIEGFKNVGEEE